MKDLLTCMVEGTSDESNVNLRSGLPDIFCHGGKVCLIQLLDYLPVASPESGLFSDWSRNKKVLSRGFNKHRHPMTSVGYFLPKLK